MGIEEDVGLKNDDESSGGSRSRNSGQGAVFRSEVMPLLLLKGLLLLVGSLLAPVEDIAGQVLGAIAGEGSDGFAKVRPGMSLVDKEVGRFAAPAGLHIAEVEVGHVAAHQDVAVLDRAALGFMHGAGVAEANILGPVILDAERDGSAVLVEPHQEGGLLVVDADHLAHEAVFDAELPVSLGEQHAVVLMDVVPADGELLFAEALPPEASPPGTAD